MSSKFAIRGLVEGRAYLLRSVTHYYLGHLEAITPTELVLSQGSWVPDTGRYHLFLQGEKHWDDKVEIEPVPDPGELIVTRSLISDHVPWPHALPREAR